MSKVASSVKPTFLFSAYPEKLILKIILILLDIIVTKGGIMAAKPLKGLTKLPPIIFISIESDGN
jgi:hypothetical protein